MHNTVFTQVEGVVDGSQLHAHQDRLRSDPAFQPDMQELMDCTGLKDARLKTIANTLLEKDSPWEKEARRAIVVSNPLAFGLLRIFQTIMRDVHGEIIIFRDMESAKVWLDL